MTISFKGTFSRIKTNLTRLDNQPLSKAALVIIVFLDLFILVSIFNGLDEHTRQLTAPDDYIPNACREIVIDRDWSPTSRIDNLSSIIIAYRNSYYPPEERRKAQHPLCSPYLDIVERIKHDKGLADLFEEREKLGREAQELQQQINGLKGGYDTALLEKVAQQQDGQVNVDKIRQDVQAKTDALNTLRGQIEVLEQKINNDPKVSQLWAKLQALSPVDRDRLRADLRDLRFWFPVKKLGMQMIFLLPLFMVFYFWNTASIKKNRGIQALVSAHLLVVAFVPIFFKIIETVYDIIPKKLLKQLIHLLETLKLVAIWHYLVIAVAIGAALFLIYIVQKKLFSHDKLMERRIAKGQCQQCGKHLPAGAQACPFCGFVQYKPCGSCSSSTHVYGKYCRECGKANL